MKIKILSIKITYNENNKFIEIWDFIEPKGCSPNYINS